MNKYVGRAVTVGWIELVSVWLYSWLFIFMTERCPVRESLGYLLYPMLCHFPHSLLVGGKLVSKKYPLYLSKFTDLDLHTVCEY